MDTSRLPDDKREQILPIAARHGSYNAHVFESLDRGEIDKASDIGFLVEPECGRRLLAHTTLLPELQECRGHKVDLAGDRGSKPHSRDRVLLDAVPL